MEKIQNIISLFEPITLDEMDSVKLLERSDTKFTFHSHQLPLILEQAKPYYRLLDIDGKRTSRYETLYFDSDDFMMYLKHQNGKLNRHKVRFRKYMETGKCYFEIKFKSNKEKTNKQRIQQKNIESTISGPAAEFLQDFDNMDAGILFPNVKINYSRMTLISKRRRERLTIDMGLSFHYPDSYSAAGANDKHITYNNFVIAEIKQDKFSYTADFFSVMKQNHIRPVRFSKYCAGVNSLFPKVKYNRFKERSLNVRKIQNLLLFNNSIT